MNVNLSTFRPSGFDRGAGSLKESVWLIVSLLLFRLCPVSLSSLKCVILRIFGAKIGRGVVIKPQVKITFPWKLEIGDFVWLGEQCWLMNLAPIVIGNNVCISQRAFLCTGNHNYRLPSFDLIVKPITVEDGAWLGAVCFVGPGVKVGSHAILTACSMISRDMESWGIYQGNPAVFVKRRTIETAQPAPMGAPVGVN